jgi:hypothetical protein
VDVFNREEVGNKVSSVEEAYFNKAEVLNKEEVFNKAEVLNKGEDSNKADKIMATRNIPARISTINSRDSRQHRQVL